MCDRDTGNVQYLAARIPHSLAEVDLFTDAAFAYETTGVDFIDAYNACWMKGQKLTRVVTFDEKHFARLDWVDIEKIV